MDVLHPVAPGHLVHAKGCGDGGIEARRDAPQRDANQLVARRRVISDKPWSSDPVTSTIGPLRSTSVRVTSSAARPTTL